VKSSSSASAVGGCWGATNYATHTNTYPNRVAVFVDDVGGVAGERTDDLGATTFDDGGFICVEEVWRWGYLLG
jgi:hypothetical protein